MSCGRRRRPAAALPSFKEGSHDNERHRAGRRAEKQRTEQHRATDRQKGGPVQPNARVQLEHLLNRGRAFVRMAQHSVTQIVFPAQQHRH
jgi:hypothetical protein